MEEDPVAAIRDKKDSSMVVGLTMLRDGKADAMVSAGSTGALLTGATLIVRRVRGIRRAALAPVVPISEKGLLMLDVGANAECTPEYLLQFAYMGRFYAERVLKIKNPRIGLLNIGTEKTKGGDLQLQTYSLLEKAAAEDSSFNFVGNVEPKGAIAGACDVLVCDGFSGNIMLKSMEGFATLLLKELRGLFMSSFISKIAALCLKKNFIGLKERFNADRIGGTALLGISRPVIKAHGSSGADAIKNAVYQAVMTVSAGISDEIQSNIEHMKTAENSPSN
jgi:glycerol-3-phosphate acyltransferase PlsX